MRELMPNAPIAKKTAIAQAVKIFGNFSDWAFDNVNRKIAGASYDGK